MPDVLELAHVTAGYDRTVILEDACFCLKRGTALAILGRNGVGKSTLMRTIAGHTTLHQGRILLEGEDIGPVPAWRRARMGVGYVPQEREIFPSLSVLENITVGSLPGAWTLDRLFALFPSLAVRRRNLGNQLSGGEQQMLSIARALAVQPKVLLLDEPFEGLAPAIVDTLIGALEEVGRAGLSILLAEQHARLALEMTSEALALVRGRIVVHRSSRTLLDEPELLEDALTLHDPRSAGTVTHRQP